VAKVEAAAEAEAAAQVAAQAAAYFGCYMSWMQRNNRSDFSKHCVTIGSAALLSNRIELDHSDLSRIK
jgi:hypothetical protein